MSKPSANDLVEVFPKYVIPPDDAMQDHRLQEMADGSERNIMILFKPFGENRLYFYNQDLQMITNDIELYHATIIIVTNQIREFDINLSGSILFHASVNTICKPQQLHQVYIHTEDKKFVLEDQYSLYTFEYRLHRDKINQIIIV